MPDLSDLSDRGVTPPKNIDDLLDLLDNPPSVGVESPNGSTVFVPAIPLPMTVPLAPGPWVPVGPTVISPPAPGGAPAGAPAGAPIPLGPILRPLNEMRTNVFLPVLDWDPAGVTGTGQQDGEPNQGSDDGGCREDQVCPGDPDYPNYPPDGTTDDDDGCIGWRECSALGGGGPTSIVQTGESGCGIAYCAVEAPRQVATAPATQRAGRP
jgi:hypothetical protein